MPAIVIHNPYANRWRSGQRLAEIESALQAAGIAYRLERTRGPRHATEIAARAVEQGFAPIIAAGGDGTIGEVINGIAQACDHEPWPPFGVLPTGTANDLVHNLGLPLDLTAMARLIAGGHTRLMDVGRINGRYFANNAALGLEPHITVAQQEITWLKGTPRYLVATVYTIFRKPQFEMQIEWEGGRHSGPTTIVTVGNHRATGGMFYMTPHADGFDGRLTFVFGFAPTRRRLLQLLPKTMKPDRGNYVEEPDIYEIHSPWLRVHCEPPTPAHADGEIFTTGDTDFEFDLVPARLPILMPTP